jgi:hypothetical protein
MSPSRDSTTISQARSARIRPAAYRAGSLASETTPIPVTVAGSVATSPQVGPVISMAALQFMSSCRNLLA